MFFKQVKRPLIFTSTALVFATPICIAEVANGAARDSSRYEQPEFQQPQKPLAQALAPLTKSFRGQTPQTIRTYATPSIDDVLLLQSKLSSAQSQLKSLKEIKPRDPELSQQINQLIQTAEQQIETLTQSLRTATSNYLKYVDAIKFLQTADDTYATLKAQEEQALSSLQQAQTQLETAQETYQIAQTAAASAATSLNTKLENTQQKAATLATAAQNLQEKAAQLEQAEAHLTLVQSLYDQSYALKNQAQSDYDTLLISDPLWTPPTYQQERTRQVPQTTTQLTGGLHTKVYDRNGYNESPPMPSTNETPIHTTTVPNVNYNWQSGQVLDSGREEDVIVEFRGYISPTTSGYYRFYTPADDGTKLYINNQLLIDDWYDKGGGGSVSNPIYLEANTAHPVTLFYYENGGGAAVSFYYYTPTEGYRIVPAAWLGTQTQTTTTYITETYYTTELVPGATAPLIKNPARLQTLNQRTQELEAANLALVEASDVHTLATAQYQSAQQNYDSAEASSESANSDYTAAQTYKAEAEATEATALTTKNDASTAFQTATSNYETAKAASVKALTVQQEAEKQESTAGTTYNQSLVVAKAAPIPTETLTEISTLQSKEPTPTPEPEPEELPEVISAESILATDLSQIDPTTMTEEQAEQLKEAALEIFLTAEPGSAEYEQALDALFLAAEQDDIVLDPALAAIPGLAAATELVNFLGNAGSDMSPEKREESKKVIVTAVVAAGAAIQSAAAAAASAIRR